MTRMIRILSRIINVIELGQITAMVLPLQELITILKMTILIIATKHYHTIPDVVKGSFHNLFLKFPNSIIYM